MNGVKAYHFMHLVCSIHLSYAHYIISAHDLCLGIILLLFSTEAGAVPRFHYISTCSQFVRTDSCLLLWRRRSENIEPAHSTQRQHRRHYSDSSEKVLDEQSLFTALSIFHQTFQKVMPPIWSRGARVSEWMVLMVIHAVTCLLKDRILKHVTGVIDYANVFSRGHIDWGCKR